MYFIHFEVIPECFPESLREKIKQFPQASIQLEIGIQTLKPKTAENIKCEIGSALPLEEEINTTVKGRDLVDGIPKIVEVNSIEIREALSEPISTIVEAVKISLEKTPPELASDILDRGIIISGGGALTRRLDDRIMQETHLAVNIADDPLTCVARGTGEILNDFPKYHKVLLKSKRL